MSNTELKYFAFISYSSKDTEWGKKLQRKLEHYRMPSALCSKKGWKRTPIRPVFFAPTDIQPGILNEELRNRLESSKHMIVICSPYSAKSKWVGEEIAYFHSLGRGNNIHFFIVDGTPNCNNTEIECFNPIINALNLPEILGVNIHEKIYRFSWLNKERAYVQLISKLLEIEYDSIWQRHRRLLIQKIVGTITSIFIVLSTIIGVWIINQPIDISVKVTESPVVNENLPPMQDAIVTLFLENEVKSDTLLSFNNTIIFKNIPHKFYGKPSRVSIQCVDYKNLDTTILLTDYIQLEMKRDPMVYGNVSLILWDNNLECPIPNTEVWIGDERAKSGKDGRCTIYIPLEKQSTKYKIQSNITLENDTVYMPSGNNYVILAKLPQ